MPARPSGTPVKPCAKPGLAEPGRKEPRPAPDDPPRPAAPKTAAPAAPKKPAAMPALEAPAVLAEPQAVSRPESPPPLAEAPRAAGPSASSPDPKPDSQALDLARAEPADPPRRPSAAANRAQTRDATPQPGNAPSTPEREEPPPGGPDLSSADRLWSAKKYKEAGQIYAALARENRLPANRTSHWAYCRIVGVATRMNARPKSAQEWDEIEAEIQSIQRLAPNLWCGEYLRDRLAEVRKGRKGTQPQRDNLVVRASAPDETPEQKRKLPRLFGKSPAGNSNEPMDVASAPMAVGGEPQVRETTNFRIFSADGRLAERAAEAAEAVREAQAARWGSPAVQRTWAPRCEIHLYPDGKAFAAATDQPETSPGFSTLESDGKRITVRKVHLRADQPQLLTAVLPHEVTHVVVADLFPVQAIPRWADEGIAVLAEPETEQSLRARELRESLSSGRLFDLRQLMSIEAPKDKDWSLYYAQSVSLTRFLVEQGTPEKLIQFVHASAPQGYRGGPG